MAIDHIENFRTFMIEHGISFSGDIIDEMEKLPIANNNHPYLVKKGIDAHGCLQNNDGRLVIPLRDVEGTVHTILYINDKGDKYLLKDGLVRGSFFMFGSPDSKIMIGEGFATCATIYETLGHCTVSACSASNLLPVTELLRMKYPDIEIQICADNDQWSA